MIASHRDIDPNHIWVGSAFHKTDLAKREMGREVVLFRAGRLASMTTNAVIRIKMKTMLFVPVCQRRKRGAPVDFKRRSDQFWMRFPQINRDRVLHLHIHRYPLLFQVP
jgi:hypothetical protein